MWGPHQGGGAMPILCWARCASLVCFVSRSLPAATENAVPRGRVTGKGRLFFRPTLGARSHTACVSGARCRRPCECFALRCACWLQAGAGERGCVSGLVRAKTWWPLTVASSNEGAPLLVARSSETAKPDKKNRPPAGKSTTRPRSRREPPRLLESRALESITSLLVIASATHARAIAPRLERARESAHRIAILLVVRERALI